MPLDPDLASLLPVLEAKEVVSYTDTPIAQARAAHDRSLARMTPAAIRAPVASVHDTVVEGSVDVRVYRPEGDGPFPVLLWFHGSGWCTGSLQTGDVLSRELCGGLPAVVVSVDYRLAPEHPWPAATDDGLAALRWAKTHAGEFGGDPVTVLLGGDSAGGNIAAAVVQQAQAAVMGIWAQLLVYPALDLDVDRQDRYPSLRQYADGYALPPENLREAVRQYVPADVDLTDPRSSPIHQPDLADQPPPVVAVVEYDPVRDHGRVYADALRDASVPVVLHEGRGLIHGSFDLIGAAPGLRVELDLIIASLRELLSTSTDVERNEDS